MKLTSAILATLRYSDHFSFPLTLPELYERLIGHKTTGTKLKAGLTNLIAQKKVGQKHEYYFLPGRRSLVAARISRAKWSTSQIARAHHYATKLIRFPGVLAIYLTGSLAMRNAEKNADIDLMIMTRPGRLWTTRLLLTLYTEVLGLRRRPNTENSSGKLCLNLYLSPIAYKLPASKRSLYTAYELIQATPLADPHNTRVQLLSANSWIADFLPNYPLPIVATKFRTLQHASVRNFWDLLEKLGYHLQRAYMSSKITREYITPDAAFFHPQDPSPKVK